MREQYSPRRKSAVGTMVREFRRAAQTQFPEVAWLSPSERTKKETKEMMKFVEHPIAKILKGLAKGLAIACMSDAEQGRAMRNSPFYCFSLYPNDLVNVVFVRKGRSLRSVRLKKGLAAAERRLTRLTSELEQLEKTTMVAPFQSPSFAVKEAAEKVSQALEWLTGMHPEWNLAKADRECLRQTYALGQVNALAYILDRLLRQYSVPKLKVKEIENLIAEYENSHLGQNIAHHPEFGSEAVRQQVRTYRKHPQKSQMDAHLDKFLNWENYGDKIDEAAWAASMLRDSGSISSQGVSSPTLQG